MRILVTGGGTGGHVTPTLAVLQSLRKKVSSLETCYVIDTNDNPHLLQEQNITIRRIKSGKFRRFSGRSLLSHITDLKLIVKNLLDVFRVIYGIGQSYRLIRQFKPQAIFIKGGYVGVPVGIAAWVLRVPYVLHDSDVVPGLANRILAPGAKKIAVGFPVQYYRYPSDKLVYSGNPVRKEFVQQYDTQSIKQSLKISNEEPVILVIGGSSGSQKINQIIANSLDKLLEIGNVIHVTGAKDYERYRAQAEKFAHSNQYVVYDFVTNLHEVLYVSDVVVSRAGASSIAEIAAMKKPVIFIPHPHVTGDHQRKNARAITEEEAGVVLSQNELIDEKSLLIDNIKTLLTDKASPYRQNISKFYKTNAADILSRLIIEEARSGKKE